MFLNMDKHYDKSQVKEFKVVERNKEGYPSIIYTKAKLPCMTDRENLIEMYQKELGDGKHLFITQSVERDDYPVSKDSIRMDLFKATCIQ